ncbi:MAG: hypothetical protein Ct9H300mP7_5280 [Verrucomicrobiota bacterium]|nr:MAG: hypothetical protein Ct9H300mP7_5280 [Verrucomicrobiota bacterium]
MHADLQSAISALMAGVHVALDNYGAQKGPVGRGFTRCWCERSDCAGARNGVLVA